MGNRIQQIVDGETIAYTYLLHDKIETAGEWTFTHDMNGNITSKTNNTDEWTYQYDCTDHLVEVHHDGQLVGTYEYDGNGHRVKKTEWDPDSQQYETVIYIYSQGTVGYEKSISTGSDVIYIYGPSGRIAK